MRNPMDIAKKALQKMLLSGADSASASFALSELNEFNAETGTFSLLRTTEGDALSLTLIKNHKRGTVTTNGVTEESMDAAVQACLSAADSSQPDEAWAFSDIPVQRAFSSGSDYDREKLFARAQELLATIQQDHPKIMVDQLVVSHRKTHSAYVNSHDVAYTTVSGNYSLMLMFLAQEGEKSSTFNYFGALSHTLDTPFIELDGVRQALSDTENQIHTLPSEGKFEGAVVFTPDCLADVLSSLLSNYVSDSALLEGTSQWKKKLGTQVVDKRITLSSQPHHPDIVGGERYTGEGFLAEDYDIIKEGVLQHFMLSLYVANKTGQKRAPNSDDTLVMQPGDTPLEDLIAGIDKGLLVGGFSGGAPGANGEFSGVAKNSFLIENGKVTSAVSETMISGNLAGMLQTVRGISKETICRGYSILPWLAVDGITISGK